MNVMTRVDMAFTSWFELKLISQKEMSCHISTYQEAVMTNDFMPDFYNKKQHETSQFSRISPCFNSADVCWSAKI